MKELQIVRVKMVKESSVKYNDSLSEPQRVISVFKDMLEDEGQEVLSMIALDTKGKMTGYFEVHRGALSRSVVSPLEIAKRAILSNAASIVIAHNHPSGDSTPSQNDTEVTIAIRDAMRTLGIKFLDHVVVGYHSYFSYRSQTSYLD